MKSQETETQTELLLREAVAMLLPLARVLVRHGVAYPTFTQALKEAFLQAARAELAQSGKKQTDSALSVLSGVHRKDVRALSGRAPRRRASRRVSMAAEVATRWSSDPAYLDAQGLPRPLPMRSDAGGGPSFESLVLAITTDFHARSVLDEMVRLGVARDADGRIELLGDAFVPVQDYAEALALWAANIHDHLAAGERNLAALQGGTSGPFIEHAVYADELTARSAEELQQLAKRLWLSAFKKIAQAAAERVERDRPQLAGGRGTRMRFGGYFFHTETGPEGADPANDQGESK